MLAVPTATSAPVERGVTPRSVAGGRAGGGRPAGPRRRPRCEGALRAREPTGSCRRAHHLVRRREPGHGHRRRRHGSRTRRSRWCPRWASRRKRRPSPTERLPFVGVATSPEWFGNPWGFGITGASLSTRSKTGEPRVGCAAAGATRRLEREEGRGRHRHRPARARSELRRPPPRSAEAGFQVAAPLTLPVPPIDAATTARSLVAGIVPPPGAVLAAHDRRDRARDRPAARGAQLHGDRGRRRQPLLAVRAGRSAPASPRSSPSRRSKPTRRRSAA